MWTVNCKEKVNNRITIYFTDFEAISFFKTNFSWYLILTVDVKSHWTRQLSTYLTRTLIHIKFIFFWTDLMFSLTELPECSKQNLGCAFSKYFVCYALVRRFPKTKITR